MRIRELPVFSVKIEREKIAKNAKVIIRIFALLEEAGVPCECIAINIDWISVTILQEYRSRIPQFLWAVGKELKGTNVILDNEFLLLCVEGITFTSRRVGYFMTSLMFNGVYPHIMRQMNSNKKLVVGVDYECKDTAIRIIRELVDIGNKSA
ncbi:hypothetical protein [Agathobacter ruminis]|uniref:hypothetical protein n=1 Tax=Agathobacter ruminis TaxID=1712665 RepID=UPI00117894F0|nr:hypothetical protein [Agathobacter ruminis]MDC7302279.1 hypothetical protein [Agathobacter ruminis]